MATTQAPIRNDGGNPVEPPDSLSEVQLLQFIADPQSADPFGPPVTLKWNVDAPLGVALRINNVPVAKTGTMSVQPAATTAYTLAAHVGQFSRTLGTVTVPVDTHACVTTTVSQDDVQSQLRSAIDAIDAQESRISQRSPASVSIDASGIKVSVRMSISIDNFPDPDLNVDFTLGLQLRDGQVEPFYQSFNTAVDWPWWVTTVTLGVSEIVESIISDRIEGGLKPAILSQATTLINGVVAQLPAGLKLFRLVTVQGGLQVTVCPVGDHQAHLVLGNVATAGVAGAQLHAVTNP